MTPITLVKEATGVYDYHIYGQLGFYTTKWILISSERHVHNSSLIYSWSVHFSIFLHVALFYPIQCLKGLIIFTIFYLPKFYSELDFTFLNLFQAVPILQKSNMAAGKPLLNEHWHGKSIEVNEGRFHCNVWLREGTSPQNARVPNICPLNFRIGLYFFCIVLTSQATKWQS